MKGITTKKVSEKEIHLSISARPRINPDDIWVPEGYQVEAVGLSFPAGMGFTEDGSLYILEGGNTWPTRPALSPRILRLSPSGELEVFLLKKP